MSVQTPTRPITGPAPAIQDPSPTRLAKKPDMPWPVSYTHLTLPTKA